MMSLAAALLAMLSLQSTPSGVPDAPSPHAPDCALDLPAMLALDEMHFDQDRTTGWRMVQARGCATEAADLLQAYRTAHPTARAGILFWHEGQVRATIGQTGRAIALFEQARRPPDADADAAAWNLYVDGSIAFLRNDRAALQRARDMLAALPPPATPETVMVDGVAMDIPWPMNLNVLDGFLRCFGRPYREAYATPCTTPMALTPHRGD